MTTPQIAAGHDNTIGLTEITALSAGGVSFIEPFIVWRQTRRPQTRVGFGGYRGDVGKPSQTWVTMLTVPQWVYLRDTYEDVNGGFVTAYTSIDGVTYANYNATLELQDYVDMEFRRFAGGLWKSTTGFTGIGFGSAQINLYALSAI